MKDRERMFVTKKEEFEKIGIPLTDKQFSDICIINHHMKTTEESPALQVLLILRALGLVGNDSFDGDDRISRLGRLK